MVVNEELFAVSGTGRGQLGRRSLWSPKLPRPLLTADTDKLDRPTVVHINNLVPCLRSSSSSSASWGQGRSALLDVTLRTSIYYLQQSTFAQALERHRSTSFRRCNQDDLGDRHSVEVLARQTLELGLSACIDRMNFDAQ